MTKTKPTRRHKSKTDSDGASLLFVSAKAYAITLGVSALLLLLFSYIAYMCSDPAAAVDISAYLCLALSSVFGGIIAAVYSQGKETLSAVCSGGMYVITLLLMALATDSINSPLYMMLGYGISVLLFVLGAYAYKKLTTRRRRRRR